MIKKNLFMSIAVTSAVLAINSSEASAAQIGVVNTSALNVRSGAGTNHSIIGKLYKGDKVDILDSSNDWYKVKLSNGKIGWASSQYIDTNHSANSQNNGTVNTSALNVRQGAGTNYSIIGKLYKGDVVNILSSSNGWYKIELSNGSTGWVSSQYITLNDSSSDSANTPSDSEDSTEINKKGTVNTSALNVRQGAGTNYSIIGKLYKGDVVNILSSSNGWYKIELSNGSTGWVSSQYITLNDSSSDSANTPSDSEDSTEINKKGTVNTSALNVRQGAGTNYSIIGKLYKGDVVNILSSSNGWYKIELSNGSTGWVSSQYITLNDSSSDSANTPSDSEDSTEINKKGTVNTSALNVRQGAGTNYSIIGKLYKGDVVNILSSSNGWYKIELSNGSTGWVSSQYITLGTLPSDDTNNDSTNSTNPNKIDAVIDLAKKQIGKPYVWGATGPDSFDCSGLTSYVYKNAANISLPRTSSEQAKVGDTISKSDLMPGDLIFSSTNGTGNVSHVGIYIGNNEMIHSPKPGQNVQIVKINTTYWNNVYLHAKRVL